MNIIFDNKTLQVVSLCDSTVDVESEQILRSMFPKNFKNFSLWSISRNITQGPIGLSVCLDKDKNPESLIYRKKIIYIATKEDKEKIRLKIKKEQDKILSQVLPRTLRSSIGLDMIKLWKQSPYTKSDIIQSLTNFKYFSEEKIIPLSWWGTFVDAGGYGNMNRSIIFRLHNYHLIAKAEILPSLPQISSTGQYYVAKHASFNFRRIKTYPRVYGFGPHPHPMHQGRTVFFTMMETETLHPTFRDLCNRYSDEIWVPSSHNKRVFEEGGVKKPILLMPLGIDEVVYSNADTAKTKDLSKMVVCDILGKPASQGINSFRFFTLFGWSYRKGTDILIKSFVKAFSGDDDVALIIFSNHVGPDSVLRDTNRYLKGIKNHNYPQILFLPGVTPELEMPSLYKIGDAFIGTSRGEGFFLPPIEAAACGLPVISCNNTGMSEYLRDDNSFMITTNEKEICSPEMHWISGYYQGQLFPKLGEDQINQAVKHMRFVVNHYNDALKKAKIFKEDVWNKYTWDKVAERVSERIKQICR